MQRDLLSRQRSLKSLHVLDQGHQGGHALMLAELRHAPVQHVAWALSALTLLGERDHAGLSTRLPAPPQSAHSRDLTFLMFSEVSPTSTSAQRAALSGATPKSGHH